MSIIERFFRVTRIFWIISRPVLGLIFSYCAVFLLEGADTSDYIAAALFALLGLVLIYNFTTGIFWGGANKWLQIITGTALILLSLALFYSTIDALGMGMAAFILLLPVWLLLAGLFEFLNFGAGIRLRKVKTKI